MKTPSQPLISVLKSARYCFVKRGHNPTTQDLLYCGIMFLSEAAKSSDGCRVVSSRKLATDLIASRSARLRLYRRVTRKN